MKKNIAIIILSTLLIISLVFAFAQATIAKNAEQKALAQREFADEQARIAQINADSAIVAQSRAEIATERARLAEIMSNQTMVKLQEAKDALAKCK